MSSHPSLSPLSAHPSRASRPPCPSASPPGADRSPDHRADHRADHSADPAVSRGVPGTVPRLALIPALTALAGATVTGVVTGVLVLSAVAPVRASVREPGRPADDGAVVSQQSDPATDLTAGATAKKPPAITYPTAGKNTWNVASGRSRVAGTKGPLLRYRVAVEKGITGITANRFAARVVQTLADERSWTGTGTVRLQRVPKGVAHDFTIHLATPQTRDTLCGDASARNPDRYTSCRNGDHVVLNVARWVHGVPHYGASLERYRAYMINHETGHRLGHHHQRCPGKGERAPVMQQQTLGLHGCVANAWPRVKGKLYTGPAGAYDDPVPDA